jgi:hypothetical protein
MTEEQFEQAKQIAIAFTDAAANVPHPVRLFALCLFASTLAEAYSRDKQEARHHLKSMHQSALELLERKNGVRQ